MMVDKNSEMSLNDVLSSIKNMVVDDVPPVLELTDMIAADGSVVKVKKNMPDESADKNPDMSSFLRLIQESASGNLDDRGHSSGYISRKTKPSSIVHDDVSSCQISHANDKKKDMVVSEFVAELAIPFIKEWINEKLPAIASKVVETEVRKLLNNRHN
jgi:cell pole-organizing protein PopZ